jgi:hypothetical protein
MSDSAAAALDLSLHPKQAFALETTATEVLYGGAAGGGKSYLMRLAAIIWCSMIPGLQVYLFRRIREDLIKNHMEGPKGFRAFLAGWSLCGFVTIVEDEIRFWNGSKIYLCHCKDEKDVYKYQGAEIHVLLIDELTHFSESMYRFLRNRVRMVGVSVPPDYAGAFPRILCGANPGNIGHAWVKLSFIDRLVPMLSTQMEPEDGGMRRQYIPARLDDNPSMASDDPGYEARLSGLGSKALVSAMRDGDWDVVEGAFFTEFTARRHVLQPFPVPEDWLRFRSMDWGSAKPFSVGWWAVASDDYRVLGTDITIPRGALVRYREWYGCVPGQPNTGLKMFAEPVAKGIAERERGEKIAYGVLDPAAFTADGGPSIAERMQRWADPELGLKGPIFRRADNKRVAGTGAMGGWDQLRSRLVGEHGFPMLYVFSTCRDFIRTVPALQHDKSKPEDLDTSAEDHVADEARYGCMSRPWVSTAKPASPSKQSGYTSARTSGSSWRV